MRHVAIAGRGRHGHGALDPVRQVGRRTSGCGRATPAMPAIRREPRESAAPAGHRRPRFDPDHLRLPTLPPGRADLIVAAIPTSYLRATLEWLARSIPPAIPVLSVVKGIEFGTFARPSQIIEQSLGPRPVAVLSGPSHAEEFARGLPASVVVSGRDAALNERIRDALNRATFRVYTSSDALGVELAGALKNILGIAAGICDGLGFGDNAKAALLTRGLVEIARLGVHLGARFETFYGLAGVGDVVTTCYSPYGRNRVRRRADRPRRDPRARPGRHGQRGRGRADDPKRPPAGPRAGG